MLESTNNPIDEMGDENNAFVFFTFYARHTLEAPLYNVQILHHTLFSFEH